MIVEESPSRVHVSGFKGHPPPPTTKLAVFYRGGFQCEGTWNATGYATDKKWDLHESQIRSKLEEWGELDKFDVLDFQRVGVAKENPESQLASTTYIRIFAQARDADILHHLGRAWLYTGMAHFAGMHCSLDMRTMEPKPFLGYYPAIISQNELDEAVTILGPCIERFAVGPPKITEPLAPRDKYPMRQHRVSTGESATQKSFAEAVFEKCRRSESFCGYNSGQGSVRQFSKAKQKALLDEVWHRGDWSTLLSSFSDYAVDETANSIIYDYWVERVRARMTDPEKMEIVAPSMQTNWWGTKRPCLERDYYEIINNPKVIVHDLKRTPIKEVTPNVLITKSGTTEEQHQLDVLILATGYDALTGSLLRLGLHDRHGTPLQKKWRDGTVTYLGLMIPGMPNMFIVNGPQTPASLTCGPPFMEQQVDWICGMITAMRARDVACVDATEQAAKKWQQEVYAAAERTLHVRADSWWMGANIPGKRREPLVYFGGSQQWLKRSLCVLEGWGGLTVASLCRYMEQPLPVGRESKL